MKLVVVGLGQAGGRIADEFARIAIKVRQDRGLRIVTDILAVNTDSADLSSLVKVKKDIQHRILIGTGQTHGHGVAKISEMGAEIAKSEKDNVIGIVKKNERFYEADAILLIASGGGGTGSGTLPVMAQAFRDSFRDKPVYAMVALPYDHERQTEERAVFNTAMCLKSTRDVTDAIILVDNQRFIRKSQSLASNFQKINELIVAPFYNLLAAGEEKNPKFIGTSVLDTGDIKETLNGWTGIGYGTVDVDIIPKFRGETNYLRKNLESQRGLYALDEALAEMSVSLNPVDAGRAALLVSGPAKELSVDMVGDLSARLREVAPSAQQRLGDYPRERGIIDVSVILSELSDIAILRRFFEDSKELAAEFQERQKLRSVKTDLTEEAARDVPSLLD
ncbi:Tubulin/FtsZ GTPase [Dehalogenimonas lykanthroporepellens BL-DC-9]|jgi:cell division GTPase FtsZ|nr:Tubulin/FtsZ GTPase [Dehalogenimonas lykanthroporepellens BL-DC-9]